MKLYSMKNKHYVERQIHFGMGNSVRTACGLVLFSRHVMVSILSNNDGALITDDMKRVTCKRCLATREARLRKLLSVESSCPGVFDRDTLCGEKWLLEHGLAVSKNDIDAQRLELVGKTTITLSNKIAPKDRKGILRNFMSKG